ncbi:MAG TPA: DUF72 domain-containing protein [Candidatus Eisenbacteria bacterium]|nr:DUF72 domain-containing protein [Candidatus Eisenbacteria bacterium]
MTPSRSGDAPVHPRLHLGTSSFSDPSWVGPFYPAGTKSGDFLAVYARRYETVEIDATFYRIPSAAQVRTWASKVPDGFRISAKVPQVITHEKLLVDAQEEIDLFLDAMSEAGDKLGPLLFQFPYFRRDAFASAKPFLARLEPVLAALPRDRRFAVEIRNKTWVTEPFLSLLREHGVAFALIDHPWMPPIDQVMKGPDPITADFTYVRWLGDRRGIEAKTETWEKLILDRESEMERWVPALAAILERNIEVFGFFNNHYAGHAPGSIALLRDVWRRLRPLG